MLKDFMGKLFSLGRWETIYFTQNLEEYARVKGKLADNNIMVKTKVTNNSTGFSRADRYGSAKDSYEILVKENEIYKANEIIHHS